MNNILLCQIQETFKNVSNDWLSSFFCKVLSSSQFGLQITFITELSDNIAISIAGEYFVAPENVGMIKFF